MKKSNAQNRLKPILFNTEMVQAILSGEKTCTRRIAKREKPPFVVGDILYVRETWCINTFGTHYLADWPQGACPEMDCNDHWHPSIYMGKDIARIFFASEKRGEAKATRHGNCGLPQGGHKAVQLAMQLSVRMGARGLYVKTVCKPRRLRVLPLYATF